MTMTMTVVGCALLGAVVGFVVWLLVASVESGRAERDPFLREELQSALTFLLVIGVVVGALVGLEASAKTVTHVWYLEDQVLSVDGEWRTCEWACYEHERPHYLHRTQPVEQVCQPPATFTGEEMQ